MKNLKNSYFLVVIFCALVIAGCSNISNAPSALNSLAHKDLEINQRVYKYSKDSTTLLFKANADNILYSRNSSYSDFKAEVKIELKLIDLDLNSTIFEDSSLFTDIKKYNKSGLLVGQLKFPTPNQNQYLLKARYTDLNKKKSEVISTLVKNEASSNNIEMLLLKPNGLPLIDFVNIDTGLFTIEGCEDAENFTLIHTISPNLPLPPFIIQEDILKESKKVEIDRNFRLSSADEGYYQILKKSNENNLASGFNFFHQPSGFPKSNDYKNLISAVGYFSGPEKVTSLLQGENLRLNFEKFWLKIANNNKEKAKKLISEYYWRIEQCNRYFTTDVAGWKSDRGMVFTILGIPTRRYKQGDNEVWVYGRDNNINNLSFSFSYSDKWNDWVLERHGGYRQVWKMAVNTWQNGKIFKY